MLLLQPTIFFFLVFLFPLGVYLTLLGGINRLPHPVLVSGTWDGVGLLFASSGFLLAVGPAILRGLYEKSVVLLLSQEEANSMMDVLSQSGLIWGTYYGLVIVGSVVFLVSRRNKEIIYNIEPQQFDGLLIQALERLPVVWARRGRRVFLHRTAPTVATAPAGPQEMPAIEAGIVAADVVLPVHTGQAVGREISAVSEADSQLTLGIDPFPALYNITLHWKGPAKDLREELEEEFRKVLPTVYTRDNPTGGWLFSVAGVIFGVLVLGFVLILVIAFLMTPAQ